jgi:hypothetical protein
MATMNAQGFYEEDGALELPVPIDADEVEKDNHRIAELSCEIEPIDEERRRVAKAHSNKFKPWVKEHDELVKDILEKNVKGEDADRHREKIAQLSCKIVPEKQKASQDASRFLETLRPLRDERTTLAKEVNDQMRLSPVPVRVVFETNERVLYRLDGPKPVEVQRTPYTAKERDEISQGSLFPSIDMFDISKPGAKAKTEKATKAAASNGNGKEHANGAAPAAAKGKGKTPPPGTRKTKRPAAARRTQA